MRLGMWGAGRRGTASVELAVCVPVIALLVLGCIETTGMIFLNQTVAASAYEGIREAVRPGATEESVESRCASVYAARSVQGAVVTISPNNWTTVAPGQPITVTVSAPTSSNRVLMSSFVRDVTVSSSAVMLRE